MKTGWPGANLMSSELDDVGVDAESDLSSLSRDYLQRWEPFLAPLREAEFDLLHLGIGNGASLRMWGNWFPQARLVGLDPRRIVLDPPILRCEIFHGHQLDH